MVTQQDLLGNKFIQNRSLMCLVFLLDQTFISRCSLLHVQRNCGQVQQYCNFNCTATNYRLKKGSDY